MKQIKFSIVIPVYNGEKYLQETLDSIKSQNYKNYEVILVDGLSRDKTMEIVSRNGDMFYKIVSEKDNGMYEAINKGFNMATGTHYYFINSNDKLLPNTLGIVAKEFEQTGCDMIMGNINFISEQSEFAFSMKGTKIAKKGMKAIQRMTFAQPSVFWTSEIYKELKGFDTSFKYRADAKFLLSAYIRDDIKVGYINATLAEFRIHNDHIGEDDKNRGERELKKYQNEVFGGKPSKLKKCLYECLVKFDNRKGILERIQYERRKSMYK